MKFLLDVSPSKLESVTSHLVLGQLLTPLTQYANAGGVFAIDNGAYSGLDAVRFTAVLDRERGNHTRCLFTVCPDVVGNSRRTMELWNQRHRWTPVARWALVAQDGVEDLDIPWDDIGSLFVGGNDPWKDSHAAWDVVKVALALGVRVHIGRVNTAKRYLLWARRGAHTCDGSGVSRYDHMLRDIEAAAIRTDYRPLLTDEEREEVE